MRHTSLLLALSLVLGLGSCNQAEKKAQELLSRARQSYQAGDLEGSKQLLDSIKILYPKAYEARHMANDLSYEVEKTVQERNISYLDSLERILDASIKEKAALLVLEKDAEYQSQGNYLDKSQVLEGNLRRSYLRFQTLESGQMSMTSIYCSSGAYIHHTSVEVTAKDGSKATSPISKDSYETEDLGYKIEKADFKLGEDGGVIDFCAQHADEGSLKLTLKGDRSFNTTLTKKDLEAAVKVLELSRLLSEKEQVGKKREEAQTKIRFIGQKQAEKAAKDLENEK